MVDGSASLFNLGTLTIGDAVIGGALTVYNANVVNQTAVVTIGDGSGQVGSIVNQAGKTYNLSGAVAINNGAASASNFRNSGAFDVVAGLGVATIATTFDNLTSGDIDVTTGALQDNGALVNTGTIAGARLIIEGQANVQHRLETHRGRDRPLWRRRPDPGRLARLRRRLRRRHQRQHDPQSRRQHLHPDRRGHLSGQLWRRHRHWNRNVGAYRRCSMGGGGGLIVGGKVTLNDTGTVTATGGLQVGDSSAKAATAVIGKGGVWNLTSDSAGVGRGASAASKMINNGLFEKTAGTGTSVVSVDFVNNGTITVTSGTIEFLVGDLTGSGTINGVITHNSSGDTFVSALGATPGVQRLVQAAASLGSAPAISSAPALRQEAPHLPLAVGHG